MTVQFHANIVDIPNRKIFEGILDVKEGKVFQISEKGPVKYELPFLLPGFVDSHVHVESSMLVPSEFARLAVVHGTVGTISDPHEIANVCGIAGVNYMIENGKTVPFKFHFGAPSCVPATIFETAGASLDADQVKLLLENDDIYYLSEMMNFPGVLFEDEQVMKKIAASHAIGKPVDGHAPGLRGADAKKYISAGISTDHECFTYEEALEKIGYGMKILIREGSAAKNFEALIPLLADYPNQIMFCSDDKHPDSLEEGHINDLCARAVAKGIDLFHVLQAACINPVKHYGMRIGLLQPGDTADFVLVQDLTNFKVISTWIDGLCVAQNGKATFDPATASTINQFSCSPINETALTMPFNGEVNIPVIEALDGQLITNKILLAPTIQNDCMVSDPTKDLLKMVVVNRYFEAPIAKTFVKNFGLQTGALASTVAHDSHNIIAVGVDDASLTKAINAVIAAEGGIAAVSNGIAHCIGLPVAGLMTNQNGYEVSKQYTLLDNMVKDELKSTLRAPFMTLSFMALLVIPHLKLSDKGLFDGDTFSFV
jgi:adenine deaminase